MHGLLETRVGGSILCSCSATQPLNVSCHSTNPPGILSVAIWLESYLSLIPKTEKGFTLGSSFPKDWEGLAGTLRYNQHILEPWHSGFAEGRCVGIRMGRPSSSKRPSS